MCQKCFSFPVFHRFFYKDFKTPAADSSVSHLNTLTIPIKDALSFKALLTRGWKHFLKFIYCLVGLTLQLLLATIPISKTLANWSKSLNKDQNVTGVDPHFIDCVD